MPANGEAALAKAVADQPNSVADDAGGFELEFYLSGFFTGACGTIFTPTVMLLLGIESVPQIKFWIVKVY